MNSTEKKLDTPKTEKNFSFLTRTVATLTNNFDSNGLPKVILPKDVLLKINILSGAEDAKSPEEYHNRMADFLLNDIESKNFKYYSHILSSVAPHAFNFYKEGIEKLFESENSHHKSVALSACIKNLDLGVDLLVSAYSKKLSSDNYIDTKINFISSLMNELSTDVNDETYNKALLKLSNDFSIGAKCVLSAFLCEKTPLSHEKIINNYLKDCPHELALITLNHLLLKSNPGQKLFDIALNKIIEMDYPLCDDFISLIKKDPLKYPDTIAKIIIEGRPEIKNLFNEITKQLNDSSDREEGFLIFGKSLEHLARHTEKQLSPLATYVISYSQATFIDGIKDILKNGTETQHKILNKFVMQNKHLYYHRFEEADFEGTILEESVKKAFNTISEQAKRALAITPNGPVSEGLLSHEYNANQNNLKKIYKCNHFVGDLLIEIKNL